MLLAFRGDGYRFMKRIAGTALFAISLLILPLFAQTPDPKRADDLSELIKEVQTQQATIAQNQAKIDEKLATLGETIREARIFSSRGGH
jgi:hypothetical protein